MRSFIVGFMLTRRIAGAVDPDAHAHRDPVRLRLARPEGSLPEPAPSPNLGSGIRGVDGWFCWLIGTDLFSPRLARFDLAVLIASAGYAAVLFTAAASVAPIYAPANVQLERSLKQTAVGFWVISMAAFTVVRWLVH